jgi:D-serine deaminase-like pyridoxal phosphate-dependent protein
MGPMCFTLGEAIELWEKGERNILVGYPTMNEREIQSLVNRAVLSDITLMIDHEAHLEMLESLGSSNNKIFNVCLDVDMSSRFPGLNFGVNRSALRTVKDVKKFLPKLAKCSHLKLVGVMGYEAQIAGVTDAGLKNEIVRILKRKSLKEIFSRRTAVLKLLNDSNLKLDFVNGGGTGSLKDTIKESGITEVTIGSGFYSPGLFDHYVDFKYEPSLSYALPVVRNPTRNIYTALGGGYIASGSVDKLKAPTPYLPEGLELFPLEGAGEVQTPFRYRGKESVMGEKIFLRHAKAGEVCERFKSILCYRDEKIVDEFLTYRGEGYCFL